MNDLTASLAAAADAIRSADALLVGAGAGMGVDSGLPDFRGPEGFWRAYPPFRTLGLRFEQLANPAWFARDPALAWGFYGHRQHAYRTVTPHAGFAMLLRWAAAKPGGFFVVTSNVDGQFQKIGFPDDRVVECHGSIHHLQCARPCTDAIWPATHDSVAVDPATMRAAEPWPRCPNCQGVARPNILMFGDGAWVSDRTEAQTSRLQDWYATLDGKRLAIVECGAGTAIPSIRHESERAAARHGGTLVRVNLREPQVPRLNVGLPMGALAALQAIAERL